MTPREQEAMFAADAGAGLAGSESYTLPQARAYLAKVHGAVSGAGGHNATFRVACLLVRFNLLEAQTWALLCEWNTRCQPPWSERELRHKLDDAFRVTRPDSRPALAYPRTTTPKAKIDPTTAAENYLKGFRCGETDLWAVSQLRPPDDWRNDALALVEVLYRPDERINFVTNFAIAKDGKATPKGIGETVERDALIARWRQRGMPRSKAGGWLRMNPLNGQGVGDASVTAHRFALLEGDGVPVEIQLSLFAKLPLPIAAILTSGGRSLHAWVRVGADDAEDYRRTVGRMLELLAKFGIDGKNKNPSRLSRLPGVVREIGRHGDGRQRLLYLNPRPRQEAIL
jgi:hypothetical protein